MNFRDLRRKQLLFASILVVSLILQSCVSTASTPQHNRAENGAWLSVDWVNEPQSADEITRLAQTLHQQDIRYVFVFASYLKDYGDFNPTYEYAAEFVQAMKVAVPELRVLAWVGVPVQNPNVAYHTGYVDLTDSATRLKIASFSKRLIDEAAFDGVHLDPEPISSDDQALLALLDETRQAIGPDYFLSLATPRIRPTSPEVPFPEVSLAAWQADYYRQVAKRVDQMAVMAYDSGTTSPELYQKFVHFQTLEISQSVEGVDVHLLIGLPTYAEWTATHDPANENLTTGIQGVRDGLLAPDADPETVDGIAIYPYWEFGEEAVQVYQRLWLDR